MSPKSDEPARRAGTSALLAGSSQLFSPWRLRQPGKRGMAEIETDLDAVQGLLGRQALGELDRLRIQTGILQGDAQRFVRRLFNRRKRI